MPHALPDHFGEKIALSIVSASIAETGLCAWVREVLYWPRSARVTVSHNI